VSPGCGSCPTKPGNNVGTGEITVNYVSSACNEGVCDYKRNAARDEVAAQVAPDQTIDQTIDQTADQSVDADIAIDTSPAQTADNIQTLGMGINCKGSSYCKYCRASLDQILETLDKMRKYTQHSSRRLLTVSTLTKTTVHSRRPRVHRGRENRMPSM
jgi:ferredoxin